MKHCKLKLCILILIFCVTFLSLRSDAFCSDVAVSDIKALVVEKGVENYSISVQANVTNLNQSNEVTVMLIALDINGYQIKDITLNGRIDKGKTKVLKALVQMPKKSYEDIFKWEWKANK